MCLKSYFRINTIATSLLYAPFYLLQPPWMEEVEAVGRPQLYWEALVLQFNMATLTINTLSLFIITD